MNKVLKDYYSRLQMKIGLMWVVLFIILGFFTAPVFAEKGTVGKSQQNEYKKKEYVEGEILVKYKNNSIQVQSISERTNVLNGAKSLSLEEKEDLKKENISILKITDAKTVEQKIAELKNDPAIEYVQPNYQYYPTDINTNDPQKGFLWGIENTGQTVGGEYRTNNPGSINKDIDAPEAWKIAEATTSTPVIVAVIDTGVAYNHPDLSANMWDGSHCKDEKGIDIVGGCNHGYDYEDNDTTPLPTHSDHGTHVAGIIAAVKDNGRGVIGVAPQAKIMAIKSSLTTADNIKSIYFAKQNGASIINASWGGTNNDPLLQDAIASFHGLFITAAGNRSADNDGGAHFYPSDYELHNIISVAATDQNDVLATFSDYGTTSVDVAAPGTNILSTGAESISFSENFENAIPLTIPEGWIKTGTWGTVDLNSKVLFGDTADSANSYVANANSIITFPNLNLGGASGATLDFSTGCDTEYDSSSWTDYMQLEYSKDGVDFSPLPFIFGDSRWDEATLDLLNSDTDPTGSAQYNFYGIALPSPTNNSRIRIRWTSNAVDNIHSGCWIDTIKITTFSDGSDEKYEYKNGTSMASPYVAGLAALIEGYNTNLTVSQVKNAIVHTGDSVESLSGKIVSGKRIHAQKALQSINPSKAITLFTIPNQIDATIIDESAHTILVSMPYKAVVVDLVPAFTTTGASVAIGVIPQVSTITSNDFTRPLTYTVSALDSSTQAYTVTVVTSLPSDLAALTAVIALAQSKHDAALEGNLIGQYPPPLKANLQTAITQASLINETSAQSSINTAVSTLNTVIGTFEAGVIVRDVTPPITTLNGITPQIEVGGSYVELGATAVDNIDGIFIAVPSGSVNTAIVGTYTVTYTASDIAGNVATPVIRIITVIPSSVVQQNTGGGGGGSGGGGGAPIFSVTSTPAPISKVPIGIDTHSEDCKPGDIFSRTTGKRCLISGITPVSTTPTQGQVLGAQSFHFTLLLKKGSRGNEVKELQKFLTTSGFDIGIVDGIFGQKTKIAVAKFQIAHGLKGDGIVGMSTRKILNK